MSAAGSKLTCNDLLSGPEDQLRHEIIDGEHFMSLSPLVRHPRISRRLWFALERWAPESKTGEVFSAPTDVVFSPTNVVVPDLLFVSAARAGIISEAAPLHHRRNLGLRRSARPRHPLAPVFA